MNWSKKHSECVNCGTNETQHKGHGYCRQCYRLHKYKEEVMSWNSHNHNLLEKRSTMEIEKFKQACLSQIDARLHLIKRYEQSLMGTGDLVDSVELEMLLRKLASEIGIDRDNDKDSDSDKFFGAANYFDIVDAQDLKQMFAHMLYKMRLLKRFSLNERKALYDEELEKD